MTPTTLTRMTRNKAVLVALLAVGSLSLGACGKKVELKPGAGETLPVAPAGAETPPTADDLITPKPQTRPDRSDELLRRSEKRKDDPFDLPPPG